VCGLTKTRGFLCFVPTDGVGIMAVSERYLSLCLKEDAAGGAACVRWVAAHTRLTAALRYASLRCSWRTRRTAATMLSGTVRVELPVYP
jgi:hypothetical protein